MPLWTLQPLEKHQKEIMTIVKTVAAAIAVAQNVPFPGSRQERIAEAAIAAYDGARNITTVQQLDDLPVDTLVLCFEDPYTDPSVFLKLADGSWNLAGDHHGKDWTFESAGLCPGKADQTLTVVRFGNGE